MRREHNGELQSDWGQRVPIHRRCPQVEHGCVSKAETIQFNQKQNYQREERHCSP